MLNASQAASGNYGAATATTSFTVAAAIFTHISASNSATTTAGGAATYTLMLTPASGTIPDAVTMSATGLPSGATATFSPATIAAGSGTTTVIMTIETSSSQMGRNENPLVSLISVALGFLLLPVVRMRLRQISFLPLLLAATTLLLSTALVLSGCSGSGSSSSSAQARMSYTVVATATDATRNAVSSTNLTLTVK